MADRYMVSDYELNARQQEQTVQIPAGFELRGVWARGFRVYVRAEIDPNQPKEDVSFVVLATNQASNNRDALNNLIPVGSVDAPGGERHIYCRRKD